MSSVFGISLFPCRRNSGAFVWASPNDIPNNSSKCPANFIIDFFAAVLIAFRVGLAVGAADVDDFKTFFSELFTATLEELASYCAACRK